MNLMMGVMLGIPGKPKRMLITAGEISVNVFLRRRSIGESVVIYPWEEIAWRQLLNTAGTAFIGGAVRGAVR